MRNIARSFANLSVTLTALVGLVFGAPAVAQQPAEAGFGELVEVSEVLLDVLVTNQEGDVVVGLQPDDFVVVEGSRERPVTGASFYSNRFQMADNPSAGKIQHPAADEIPADRYFVLFFHDQRRLGDPGNRLYRQQMRASKHAKRWIEEEMLQGDWVAVLSYDVKLKVQTDFTRDRERLLRAVSNAALGKDPGNTWASRRPESSSEPSLIRHLPEGKELREASKNLYDGLSLAAEATRDIVGRKNLLLFTIGFGDLRNSVGTGLSLDRLVARPDERYYPDLKASLNDNNVAVYPIDLTPSEWEHAQRDFLNLLAVDTGGYYHFNFVSFMTPMRQIADEANGYYLLSYMAEHRSGANGYRNLKVKAKNPEFKVRARTGYRFGA